MKKINLISDFYATSPYGGNLETEDREQLSKDFQKWFDEKMKDFEFASRFLMCHLGNPELYHPHYTAIVTNATAEVLQSEETVGYNNDYVPD